MKPMPIKPARIRAATLTTAAGRGRGAHLDALARMRPALRPAAQANAQRPVADEVSATCWVGAVDGLEDAPLTGALAKFDCRNNRLAAVALNTDDFAARVDSARRRWGAHRIGVFVGTSTSGIRHSELCYRRHVEQGTPGLGDDLRFDTTHAYSSVADFCRQRLGLAGPAMVISTACSSGAKTFAAAQRALSVGICDAAVVGGVDSLCATTLLGFEALGLLSPTACTPWGLGRRGISIGEGAAFALLDLWDDDDCRDSTEAPLLLLGYGESDDAYHIATPHPEGVGAVLAMRAALETAGLRPSDIDYINLHGTGTPANDQAEDRAVTALFGREVPVSGTKGWTGHTLGAAGAVEAVLSLLCIEHGLLPGTLNTETPDPALGAQLVRSSESRHLDRVLSNSFGFAGNNCTLVLGRA
jgi:3-oxoacyl-[acyl-carrier-protein] synthase-1